MILSRLSILIINLSLRRTDEESFQWRYDDIGGPSAVVLFGERLLSWAQRCRSISILVRHFVDRVYYTQTLEFAVSGFNLGQAGSFNAARKVTFGTYREVESILSAL
jgi:hypothetical protein